MLQSQMTRLRPLSELPPLISMHLLEDALGLMVYLLDNCGIGIAEMSFIVSTFVSTIRIYQQWQSYKQIYTIQSKHQINKLSDSIGVTSVGLIT